jgi:SPP1 gp7 family putative phage head morphogenesis protein
MARKTPQDPTGQKANRARVARGLIKRLRNAKRRIMREYRAIHKTRRSITPIQNQAKVVYDYNLTAAEIEAINAEIRRLLNDELLETQQTDQVPPDWWYKPVIEQPYRQGTAEELVQYNQMIAAAVVAGVTVKGIPPRPVPVEEVLLSQPYIEQVNTVYAKNFGTIKTLSDTTAEQVIRVVNDGIDAGATPTDIARDIVKRFDVSESSAKRIARTEVNKAYTDAKMNATDAAAAQTGLRSGVIHISALTPTTRQGHADRHGNAYAVADQKAWWAEGANRINCLCNIRSVLIDSKGKVVQKELQDRIKQQGREFFD